MNKQQHTPGPWTATQYGYEKFSVNGEKGVEICGAWNKANARLIASAPELLELAEEWLSRQGNDANYMTAKFRTITAKARGE